MGKETFYFSHDYNTRADSKIKRLLVKHGYEGYGLFWAIIEDLYNNANALPLDYESIAYDLRTDYEKVKSIINDFDLFTVTDEKFSSESVGRRLEERNQKSVKAREIANKRWGKPETDAKALRDGCVGNAIKESKVKESKGKESKRNSVIGGAKAPTPPKSIVTFEDRRGKFYAAVAEFKDIYPKEMLRAFFDYWQEPNRSKTKMRYELEKTWELSRRLTTWANNDFKSKSYGNATSSKSVKLGTSDARLQGIAGLQ